MSSNLHAPNAPNGIFGHFGGSKFFGPARNPGPKSVTQTAPLCRGGAPHPLLDWRANPPPALISNLEPPFLLPIPPPMLSFHLQHCTRWPGNNAIEVLSLNIGFSFGVDESQLCFFLFARREPGRPPPAQPPGPAAAPRWRGPVPAGLLRRRLRPDLPRRGVQRVQRPRHLLAGRRRQRHVPVRGQQLRRLLGRRAVRRLRQRPLGPQLPRAQRATLYRWSSRVPIILLRRGSQ